MKPETRTILLKACPRCRGDLIYDLCEKQRLCLQCGHRLSSQQERDLLERDAKELRHGDSRTAAPASSLNRSQVGVTSPI
ncbi:MAG: hypothetical protein Q7R39_20350 [Dehalococcoidia bacterium]|nr:hypothetical protein [Dehalococcoidia bacterium]